jgi:nucleoid DNA-binding protein
MQNINKRSISKRSTRGKALIALVAESAGYHKYEVQDILHSLALVIQDELSQGNTVRIDGLGTFSVKQGFNRTFFSTITGKVEDTKTRNSISLKPDSYMLNALNCDAEKGLGMNESSDVDRLNALNDGAEGGADAADS